MAPCFADIIQSHQFEFLVGEEEVPISVHAAALAATSDPIQKLIYGSMKEAGAKSAKLKYVTPGDFVRFCEYAYTGDYAVPSYELDDDLPTAQTADGTKAQSLLDHDGRGSWNLPTSAPQGIRSKVKTQDLPAQSGKSVFRSSFRAHNYLPHNKYRTETTNRFTAQLNESAQQDFTPVFLAHARLYMFARMHLISNLEALTLSKLHETLGKFRLYEARIGDVVALARYAYCDDNTSNRKDDGTIDELRKLIVKYIVSMLDDFGNAPVFLSFLEEGGEFVGDLFDVLRKGLL